MDNKEKLLIIINRILEGKGFALLEKINSSDKLRDDLGFDSFDLAELTVIIEEDYNVDIFSDGIVENVSEILDKIDKI
jgi:acyl carrier protein